jgi:hypothetical protein
MKCEQELCPSWTGDGCICEVFSGPPLESPVVVTNDHESEGWASYAAEQERHAETLAARNAHFEARNKMAVKVEHLEARLADMTREVRLSRESTERAVASRIARHELERALRAADWPEDSMATDDDSLRYAGRAEAVSIIRDMLELDR